MSTRSNITAIDLYIPGFIKESTELLIIQIHPAHTA
jgi:hypothetical protein